MLQHASPKLRFEPGVTWRSGHGGSAQQLPPCPAPLPPIPAHPRPSVQRNTSLNRRMGCCFSSGERPRLQSAAGCGVERLHRAGVLSLVLDRAATARHSRGRHSSANGNAAFSTPRPGGRCHGPGDARQS